MPRNSRSSPLILTYLGGRKATLRETATERPASSLFTYLESRSRSRTGKHIFQRAISPPRKFTEPRSPRGKRGNKEVLKTDERTRSFFGAKRDHAVSKAGSGGFGSGRGESSIGRGRRRKKSERKSEQRRRRLARSAGKVSQQPASSLVRRP